MSGRETPRRSPERKALERHVVHVQQVLRTCEGCGLCCTDAHNGVKVLPLEAKRIVLHLETLPAPRRTELLAKVTAAVTRYRLRPGTGTVRYTCPFLDPHQACTLPLHVKPTACLSFNPLDLDRCAQEPEWYFPTHDREASENRRAGLDQEERPLPVAVLVALGMTGSWGGEPKASTENCQGSGTSPGHQGASARSRHAARSRRRRRR